MMDFRLGEDREALVEGVRSFLDGAHGPKELRALDAAPGQCSPQIWQGLVDLGITGLLVPESEGGLGLSLVEGALIAIELGRSAVAEPIVDTALVAAPWLAARGETALLREIAAGRRVVALAHPVNPWVADLDRAGDVIVGEQRMSAPDDVGEMLESIDPLRRLFAFACAGQGDDHLLDLAALMAAAQLQGLAEAMLRFATDYAGVRRQFGQPIGAFQAVKHLLADVAVKTEFSRPVVLRAAEAMATGKPSAPVHVSHAKLAAGQAAVAAAETAIQVHGAMGYTYEVDLHFWMKRAWALAGAWGDRAFHLDRIAGALIGGTLPIGPENSFE